MKNKCDDTAVLYFEMMLDQNKNRRHNTFTVKSYPNTCKIIFFFLFKRYLFLIKNLLGVFYLLPGYNSMHYPHGYKK